VTGELSTAAIRLLVALRAAEAYGPDRALTDRVLAERTRLPVRQVIDAAGELLDAGYLVLARCTRPPGRYLLQPGDDLAPAHDYLASLRGRALAVFRRRRAVRLALAAYAARAAAGQLTLWPPAAPTGSAPRRDR